MQVEYKENCEIKTYTTFKIGGTIKKLWLPKNQQELVYLLKTLKDYIVLGNCSNVLISSKGYSGNIILTTQMRNFEINGSRVIVDCGVKGPFLAQKACEASLSGFEFMIGFPGTIGGEVYMNASCFKKSMDHIVRGVICLNSDGKIIFLKDLKCGYRKTCFSENHLIILKVLLEFQNKKENSLELLNKYQEIKRNTQPVNTYTAGSMFINGINYQAWELIDKLGLRGFRINDAIISLKHTNFFVNLKNATFNEMLALIYYVKISVLINYQIDLKTEVKIITNNSIAYS